MNKLITAALWYKNTHAISVIPCKDKRPLVKSWKEYQVSMMSDEEIHTAFASAEQIATICGIVSSGLEVLDFDLKHIDPIERQVFWDAFVSEVNEVDHNLFSKLQFNSTQSGGYHILYRSEEIDGNKKLANKLVNGKYECIIETRGEGGYVIAPPSPGYNCIEDNFKLSLLSAEEREVLINICRSYHEEPVLSVDTKKIQRNPHRENFKKSPFEDYNESGDIISFLQSQGWKVVQEQGEKIYLRRPGSENFQSANWHRGKRILYMFSSGDIHLDGGRGYNASQVYTLIAHKGDYKESYKALRLDGYGTPWSEEEKRTIVAVRQMQGEDVNKIKAAVTKQHPSWLDVDITSIIETALQGDENQFWFFDDKGNIAINNIAFIRFLSDTLHYALWDDEDNEGDKQIIRIDPELHQVEIVHSNDVIKRDVINWLIEHLNEDANVKPDAIWAALFNRTAKLFTKAAYEWLPAVKIDTFNDTRDAAYFFFKNGIVKVSREDKELIKYQALPENTYIWKNRITCKDYNISLLDDEDRYLDKQYTYTYIDKKTGKRATGHGSAWYKYIRRISGLGPEYDKVKIEDLDPEALQRFISTMSIIGYLLHSYKDEARPWAIIINEDTATDGKGGGSGKQIFTKGLSLLRNLKEEDGRQLDIKERFAFQGLSGDQDIYVMDDVPKWFKLDKMYRMFTNDIVTEIRNVGRKTIRFKDSPKFVFSTNYDITGTEDANHLQRRIKQLLFNCYYGPDNLPVNEIGMLLDSGWDKDDEQWMLFFNFMFQCVYAYLEKSVVELPQTANTREKKIRNKYGDEFFEFMQDQFNEENYWQYDWWVLKPFWQHYKDKYDLKTTLSDFKKMLITYMDQNNFKYEINMRYVGNSSFPAFGEDDMQSYKKYFAIKIYNL